MSFHQGNGTKCFPDKRVDKRVAEMTTRSLRLIRNAFATAGIPLFIVFGSYLGSIRYHNRMPFDVDYDLSYFDTDKSKVEALLMRLAFESKNEMRTFGSSVFWSSTKVGLVCGQSMWWRKPEE